MGQGISGTTGLLIGAAAFVTVVAGTRLLFENEQEVEGSPLANLDLTEACWHGTITVDVTTMPHKELDCEDKAMVWRGSARVNLREKFKVLTEKDMVGGVLVSRDVGLVADLWWDGFMWEIHQDEYVRECVDKSDPDAGVTSRIISHEPFDAYGIERNQDVAGAVNFMVQEKHDLEYGRNLQYHLNRLPSACRSWQPWTTPGRDERNNFHVPVSCLFGSHFADGFGIGTGPFGVGLRGSDGLPKACQDGRFIEFDKENRGVMAGQTSCRIVDEEGKWPSPHMTTGEIYADWSLRRGECIDDLPAEHPRSASAKQGFIDIP